LSTVGRLGDLLSADEAARIAAELRLRRLPHLAAKRAFPANVSSVKLLLTELTSEPGGVERAASVLDGIASVPRASQPEAVWTTPSVPGLTGRTTLAAVELINQASSTVYAATYSATSWSTYVTALVNAVERGVQVTVVVDRLLQKKNDDQLRMKLPSARMWTYALTDDSNWPPRQHAKLVVVDDSSALVTSANFSDAAALRNLECGLLTQDPTVARGLRDQIDALYEHGVLVDY
jgi:phosphatidylserine/phosphatidylglycerophosphate/cardiolipin synthase-like enzyme